MRKVKTILAASVLAVSALAATAAPAAACGGKDVCDRINEVCRTVVHTYCLR